MALDPLTATLIGSAAAPVIGKGVEGLMSLFGNNSLSGKPDRRELASKFEPGVQQPLDELIKQLLGQVGSQGDFGPIADLAQKRFQQQTIPSIMERFRGAGGFSSSLGRSLGQAGADLQSQLAAQEQQFKMQEQGQRQSLLASLLGLGSQETSFRPETLGLGESTFTSMLGKLGDSLPALLTEYLKGQKEQKEGSPTAVRDRYSFLKPRTQFGRTSTTTQTTPLSQAATMVGAGFGNQLPYLSNLLGGS